MGKVVSARYDATHNMLWLDEPLDGVRDHEIIRIVVTVTGKEPEKTAVDGKDAKVADEELPTSD